MLKTSLHFSLDIFHIFLPFFDLTVLLFPIYVFLFFLFANLFFLIAHFSLLVPILSFAPVIPSFRKAERRISVLKQQREESVLKEEKTRHYLGAVISVAEHISQEIYQLLNTVLTKDFILHMRLLTPCYPNMHFQIHVVLTFVTLQENIDCTFDNADIKQDK